MSARCMKHWICCHYEMLRSSCFPDPSMLILVLSLSIKRSAKDFCRGLYNLLQADGIECFLDFEVRLLSSIFFIPNPIFFPQCSSARS